ncbi:3-oxoacyl-[acyl-carrier-protein] synthase III C-terminal domain-containing protein [uncultured Desulfovibrio sp.]|uniref:3-oxoacyl-ACP synthase III family protein n=1 Tax=uncultured Desulfovibrio sp. TaxID=167968 RepID=UPI0026040105|nr:3-oxoacyl-[acyl-carrier-protein] synthase III C-terminal domain-containing protein [uncultured Desulfovibrio sp.]
MKASVCGVKIRGICATVPQQVFRFEDELKLFPFPEKTSRRLGRVMGFNEHRIADANTTPCDLASYSMNYLFHHGLLDREKLQAVIVVAQMADHPVPGNSKVIHGQLGLPKNVFCTDIYENCIGFISGLYTACSYVAAGIDEVVLINTDCGACRANKLDRNTYPLCGDAAAVTVVCRSDDPEDKIHFLFNNDGSRREALLVPAGGCRMPYSEETGRVFQDDMGNYRSMNDMHMDGTAVFQFVMESVPPLIEEVCNFAKVDKYDIRYHLTHQPNRFMLQKLADLMEVPQEILFNNVVEYFGNSSSVTIPVNITFNLGERMLHERPLVCCSAFGAGLSLAAAICRLGEMDFCELIEHPGNGVTAFPG